MADEYRPSPKSTTAMDRGNVLRDLFEDSTTPKGLLKIPSRLSMQGDRPPISPHHSFLQSQDSGFDSATLHLPPIHHSPNNHHESLSNSRSPHAQNDHSHVLHPYPHGHSPAHQHPNSHHGAHSHHGVHLPPLQMQGDDGLVLHIPSLQHLDIARDSRLRTGSRTPSRTPSLRGSPLVSLAGTPRMSAQNSRSVSPTDQIQDAPASILLKNQRRDLLHTAPLGPIGAATTATESTVNGDDLSERICEHEIHHLRAITEEKSSDEQSPLGPFHGRQEQLSQKAHSRQEEEDDVDWSALEGDNVVFRFTEPASRRYVEEDDDEALFAVSVENSCKDFGRIARK